MACVQTNIMRRGVKSTYIIAGMLTLLCVHVYFRLLHFA